MQTTSMIIYVLIYPFESWIDAVFRGNKYISMYSANCG